MVSPRKGACQTMDRSSDVRTANDILNDKDRGREIISVSADVTIHDALQIMLANRIGAIVVTEGGKIAGIWTERDLLKNTISEGFNARQSKIRDYMVTDLISSPHTDTVYQLLDKFLGRRLRHLFIEKDGEYIGLVSIGDVTRASLQEKTEELKAVNEILNWEYYDNWQPRKTKK